MIYFVAVPKSDASGTYVAVPAVWTTGQWISECRSTPAIPDCSRQTLTNPSDILPLAVGAFRRVELLSMYKVRDSAYGFRNRGNEWQTAQQLVAEGQLLYARSCLVFFFFLMSLVWSDTISAFYKV
jgi:hypothetical protein